MSGTVLKQLIERGGKINALSEELLRLIEESSNPAYRAWDTEQSMLISLRTIIYSEYNRAVMLESSSLLFSLIDHVETMDSNTRLVFVCPRQYVLLILLLRLTIYWTRSKMLMGNCFLTQQSHSFASRIGGRSTQWRHLWCKT